MLYSFRSAFADLLFCLFGYLAPALNSVKAICSNDTDGIKEYLTYWVVLSISTFLSWMLIFLRFINHYPPEAKVVCVLWLTLPRFQGAYRVYALFLKWSYERYESDIDDKVSVLTDKLRSTLWSKLKMVLFVLFFSSNDNLLNSISNLSSFGLLSAISGFSSTKSLADENPDNAGSESRSPTPTSFWSSPEEKKASKERFRARMHAEFKALLQEGIFIRSCTGNSRQEVFAAHDPCVHKLMLHNNLLTLQPTDGQESPKSDKYETACPEPSELSVHVNLLRSVERCSDATQPAHSVLLTFSYPESTSNLQHSQLCEARIFYLHAEDACEADMLMHGFKQMITFLRRTDERDAD